MIYLLMFYLPWVNPASHLSSSLQQSQPLILGQYMTTRCFDKPKDLSSPDITQEAAPLTSETPTESTPAESGLTNVSRSGAAELALIAIGVFVAIAALILQIQSNTLAKESIEATRKGNAAAEKSYKLQLWEDCHDKEVSAKIYRRSVYWEMGVVWLTFSRIFRIWLNAISSNLRDTGTRLWILDFMREIPTRLIWTDGTQNSRAVAAPVWMSVACMMRICSR